MPCRPDRSSLAKCQARRVLFASVMAALAAVGCGRPASAPLADAKTGNAIEAGVHDHEHGDEHDHEHPTTLAGTIEAIGSRLASLEIAFASDDHDEADSLVHELGHLLEDGEELLAKATGPVAAKARDAWSEVGDCLADVDEKLHDAGDDKAAVTKAYEEVKDRIRSAMESLREHAKSVVDPVEK